MGAINYGSGFSGAGAADSELQISRLCDQTDSVSWVCQMSDLIVSLIRNKPLTICAKEEYHGRLKKHPLTHSLTPSHTPAISQV